MGDAPDNHELDRRIAVLEERMKTMDERYDKGWALLREDMAKRDAARSEREATARWWQTGVLIAAIAALLTFAPALQRIAGSL